MMADLRVDLLVTKFSIFCMITWMFPPCFAKKDQYQMSHGRRAPESA